MTWILIVLVMVLVLGPVAYIMPTKKDRRLAALRNQARLEGGTVNLERLPKLDAEAHERVSPGGDVLRPEQACVRYQLPAAKALRHTPDVQILRGADGEWLLDSERDGTATAKWRDALVESVSELPQDTLAVAVIGQQVSMCWQENFPADSTVVTAIFTELKRLRGRLELLS